MENFNNEEVKDFNVEGNEVTENNEDFASSEEIAEDGEEVKAEDNQ